MEEKYDIFIAYHLGTNGLVNEESSYNEALKIEKFLKSNNFRCFLRDPYESSEPYSYTKEKAKCSKMFLIVVNQHIFKKCETIEQGNGRLINTIPHNSHLYDEIQAFLSQFDGKVSGPANGRIQCYCLDDNVMDYEINNLHISLAQMVPLRNMYNLELWMNKVLNKSGIDNEDYRIMNSSLKKEWDCELAMVWGNIFPPSRPSLSELACYKKYFEMVKNNANGDDINVLILGSTIEFRKLAYEESFDVYVVDYNKEYYDAVSKDLPEDLLKKEKLVICDWADMLYSKDLKKNNFDIIIGDLAIGNIKPEKLDAMLNAISELLCSDGFFLGKNLYSFSKDNIREGTIRKMFNDFFDKYDDGTLETAYAHTMYNLSIYATQERGDRKIDFCKIYNKVDEICNRLDKVNSSVHQMYCGESTSFKKKMQLSFYTYPILEIIKKLREKLYLIDTEYGKDVYSNKFPLLIFKKLEFKNKLSYNGHNLSIKINNFVHNLPETDYLQEMSKYISAQYFLVKLSEIFPSMQVNKWNSIFKNIKQQILDTIKVGISEDLVCYIQSYSDEKIEVETTTLKNVDKLEKDHNKLLGETYKLAILVYLTSTLANDYHNSNSLYTLVANKLFGLPDKGRLWEPEGAPWIRAKICLCVKNIYLNLNAEYKKLINDTLEWIITFYDYSLFDWKCEAGSHVDTRSLCCEVLLSYYDKIDNDVIKENIIQVLSSILDAYVLDGKIFETFVMYPIGKGVISAIMNKEKLENKSYVRKITTRIEFFTGLLRIIDFVDDNYSEFKLVLNREINLSIEKDYLIKKLIFFWNEFEKNINLLYKFFNEEEISSIPQIIYSYAEAFKE